MTDFPVTASDTGLTVSDATQLLSARSLTDTGAAITDTPQRVSVLADDAFAGIASNTPVLDDCNRADESNLSGGGRWTRTGSLVSSLGLFNHAIYGTGLNSQESYVRAGDLGDSEAWVRLVTVGLNGGNYSGVIVRQDPSSNTGANCYAFLYTRPGGGGPLSGLQLVRYDGSGVPTVLATYAVTPVSGDSLGLRAVGSRLEAWYKPSAGAWQRLGTATDTTLTHGYVGVRCDGFFHNTVTIFGGGPVTDTLAKVLPRTLTDTGLTFSESLQKRTLLADVALTFSESLARSAFKARALADTGLTLSDSAGAISLTDTGLTFSGALASRRTRAVSATGLAVADSTQKIALKTISDTGLAFTDALVVHKSGGGTSVSLTDVGLTLVSSLARNARLFRSVPSSGALPENGLRLTDGIRVTVNGGPSGSCTTDFRRFLLDLDVSPEYMTWCAANPGDCSAWTAYANTILAGGSPSPPSMTTTFGGALVDAGVVALDEIASCIATKPSAAPHAAFSFAISGLTVYFNNLSTPGESGLFDSWLWDFGDGATDTTNWDPAHVYAGAGTYTVTLTVVGSDSDGISSVRHLVTVFVPSTAGIHIDAVSV